MKVLIFTIIVYCSIFSSLQLSADDKMNACSKYDIDMILSSQPNTREGIGRKASILELFGHEKESKEMYFLLIENEEDIATLTQAKDYSINLTYKELMECYLK